MIILIPAMCFSEGYTYFNYGSISGQYPESMKPTLQEMVSKLKDQMKQVKENNQTELSKSLQESLKDLEKETIEVFSNNESPHLSITINRYENLTNTMDEEIQGFVESMKRHNKDIDSQIKMSDLTIDDRNFLTVKVNPSFGNDDLTSLFLVNDKDGVRHTILVITESESHLTEINTFFEHLKFIN